MFTQPLIDGLVRVVFRWVSHEVEDNPKTFLWKRIENNHVKLDQLIPGSWEGLKAPFQAYTAPW